MTEAVNSAVRNAPIPLFISIELAGALCGRERQVAYADVRHGGLPIERFGKRMLVPVARLAALAGREITRADLDHAEEIVRSRKGARSAP